VAFQLSRRFQISRRLVSSAAIIAIAASCSIAPQSQANELAWKTYNEVGEKLIAQQKYDQAEEVMQEAIKAAEQLPSKAELIVSLKLLLSIYEAQRKADHAELIRRRIEGIQTGRIPTQPIAATPQTSAPQATAPQGLPAQGNGTQGISLQRDPPQASTPPQSNAPAATTGGATAVPPQGQPPIAMGQGPSSPPQFNSDPNFQMVTPNKTSSTDPRTNLVSGMAGAAGVEVAAKELKAMPGHINFLKTVTISPDARFAASAGFDKQINYWDMDQGKAVAEFFGHKGEINCVCFSGDGGKIASSSDDKTIRIWNVPGVKEERVLTGHRTWLHS